MQPKEISVQTKFGELVAQIGCDDEFPEVLVYLRNKPGNELMLAAITDNSILCDEDYEQDAKLRIAVYSDPKKEDCDAAYTLLYPDIYASDAAWQ